MQKIYAIILISVIAASAVILLFRKSEDSISSIDLDDHEHESFHD
jgi:hypothetical protein